MDNNDSNLKPQQTGGLKLMTVFIAVLALHVVVIGGLTAYHLMSGGSADADLVTDKSSKGIKVSPDGSVAIDGQLSDGSQADKSATTTTTPVDTSVASTPTPAPVAPAAPAPATTPAPDAATTTTEVSTTTSVPETPAATPVATVTPPAPAPDPAPAPAPEASTQTGPVITPSTTTTPTSALATESVTAPSAQPDSIIGMTYIVKTNDTLARIARHNHTTMAKLKAANGLDGDLLHLGQKLIIPTKGEIASAITPTPTAETASTTTLMESSTPAPVAPIAMTSAAHSFSHHTYTVVKGDTLIHIAHKFKTTARALMIANNITNPTRLSIGKKLLIPSREARSAAVSTPANAQPAQVKPGATAQLANFTR